MRSGEQIQSALRALVARWSDFSGSERAEGQTFLNELVDCYGVDPSGKIYIFAFDDDFAMGILQARAHTGWARHRGSTLKGDLSYTPTSVFMTFPWAGAFATAEQREAVADACRRLLQRRSELCEQHQVGLTKLYNAMDDGAYADLRALHRELDEAVAACYGWPRAVAQDDAELARRLTELNRQISEGETAYEPFAYLAAEPAAVRP